jgi:hypothetical protein
MILKDIALADRNVKEVHAQSSTSHPTNTIINQPPLPPSRCYFSSHGRDRPSIELPVLNPPSDNPRSSACLHELIMPGYLRWLDRPALDPILINPPHLQLNRHQPITCQQLQIRVSNTRPKPWLVALAPNMNNRAKLTLDLNFKLHRSLLAQSHRKSNLCAVPYPLLSITPLKLRPPNRELYQNPISDGVVHKTFCTNFSSHPFGFGWLSPLASHTALNPVLDPF